ncbi:glutamate racemase [Roseateles oligotrophus]|uniref:Glutamate racemase n=1 Tax=Roseateles oligotrophus TaxID=1769250 RepID=A0ABT2Y8Y5_9BURK|nr:glutamate racemase [Roseateles oligotrophus]MCV2366748.1 glutamate racemase [Roseateles oligotrophus]
MTSPSSPQACLGVFDSGVGGLTVLRELRRQLPDVPMLYVADTAHAPYGQREPDYIIRRSLTVAEHLIAQGARVLVVACNTATAHAIGALRQRWPDLPIVGTEPGIKPAVAASRNGRIGVMATPSTIASARFADLIARHAGQTEVFSQPCPGLVALIERGELDTPALRQLLMQLCEPLIAAEVDTVLMGCTHYPLIQSALQQALGPQVQLLNIESAVAQQTAKQWQALGVSGQAAPPILQTTGSAEALTGFVQRALAWPLQAQALRL